MSPHRDEQRRHRASDCEADGGPDQEQHGGFDEQLTHEPRAAGADRETHRDFAAARCRSSEKDAGDSVSTYPRGGD
jgi:hypothetical protein